MNNKSFLSKGWGYSTVIVLLTLFSINTLQAQDTTSPAPSKKKIKKLSILAVPIVYVSPESGLSGGVGGFLNYRSDPFDTVTKPSNLRLYALYSTKGNIQIDASTEYYFFQNRRQAKIDFTYKDETVTYFGIGNDVATADTGENFQLQSFIFAASFYQQFEVVSLRSKFYVGPRFEYQVFHPSDFDPNGELRYDRPLGIKGGRASGLGFLLNYDSRDHIYYPRKGSYIEFNNTFYQNIFGSDFTFNNYILDMRRYFNFIKDQVLAVQFYGQSEFGRPPFEMLAMLGGGKRLRGIYEGRFRDKNMISMQAEYRVPLFWRIGVVGFFGIGQVAPALNEYTFTDWKAAGGAGVRYRFNKRENVSARLDVGYSQYDGIQFFITIKEAF